MTPEQAVAHLAHTEPRLQLTNAEIDGIDYRVFANAPAHLRILLEDAGAAYDGRDALAYQDERWTHAELCREVKQLANALIDEMDVKPGEPVALAMRNYPELPILILAVAAAGAVAVPMNGWWSQEELAFGLRDCGARVVFADGPRHERIQPLAAQTELTLIGVREASGPRHYTDLRDSGNDQSWPDVHIETDDDFAILYSSGSTGHPKGAVLTHRGAISAVYSWLMVRAMMPLVLDPPPEPPSTRPASLITTPLFHVTALQATFLQGISTGATIVLMHKWDPEEAVRLIKHGNITRFTGVPTQSMELMDAAQRLGEPLDSLEAIGAGGAKRPAAQVSELAETFPGAAIASGWGMTETNALGITLAGPDYLAHPEAAGRPTPPLQEVRIVDANGQALPVGEIGELTVKSAANMRCYLNQPEATAEALREGWLYTGDLARIDEEGLIYIVDRKKSIIIRGGENIACLEVEGALHRHPGVAEVSVFSIPDERLGEIVGAGVHLKPGISADQKELTDFLSDHLAHFKIPQHIWFRSMPLPRGGTDKIDRRVLRAECLSAGLPA